MCGVIMQDMIEARLFEVYIISVLGLKQFLDWIINLSVMDFLRAGVDLKFYKLLRNEACFKSLEIKTEKREKVEVERERESYLFS